MEKGKAANHYRNVQEKWCSRNVVWWVVGVHSVVSQSLGSLDDDFQNTPAGLESLEVGGRWWGALGMPETWDGLKNKNTFFSLAHRSHIVNISEDLVTSLTSPYIDDGGFYSNFNFWEVGYIANMHQEALRPGHLAISWNIDPWFQRWQPKKCQMACFRWRFPEWGNPKSSWQWSNLEQDIFTMIQLEFFSDFFRYVGGATRAVDKHENML